MDFKFEKVKFSITDSCEGKCGYCYRGPIVGGTRLKKEVVETVVENCISIGLQKIHISGGNPMLHPNFDNIMLYTLSKNLPTKLSANATLLSRDRLHRYCDKGLSELALSIDSLDPNQHDIIRGIKGDFTRVISLLDIFGNTNLKIVVTVVIEPLRSQKLDEIHRILDYGENIYVKIQLLEKSLLPDRYPLAQLLPPSDFLEYLYRAYYPELQYIYERIES